MWIFINSINIHFPQSADLPLTEMSVTPIEKTKSIQSTEVYGKNIPDSYEYVEPKELAGRYITFYDTMAHLKSNVDF